MMNPRASEQPALFLRGLRRLTLALGYRIDVQGRDFERASAGRQHRFHEYLLGLQAFIRGDKPSPAKK